jgi:hypothetical protein
MCQAVYETELTTECFAVDTWTGDEHAGVYSEDVFETVRAENSKYDRFSTLLRKTFDEALKDIEDGSVDLLHVDGRHFYEDVNHDFESWIPKLSDRAVVLFHDTIVQERGFGVYKYWADISEKYPSFNFTHCHGLGVLFYGSSSPSELSSLVALSRARGGPGVVESFFETVGSAVVERCALEDANKAKLKAAADARCALEDANKAKLKAAADARCALEDANKAKLKAAADARTIETKTSEISILRDNIEAYSSLLIDARKHPLKQLKCNRGKTSGKLRFAGHVVVASN